MLRLKQGGIIHLFDGKEFEAKAQIRSLSRKSIELDLLEVNRNPNEPKLYVAPYCATLKKSVFELVVQKATEVGVKEIIPVITNRTVKPTISMIGIRKIVKETAEQSGRAIIPKLVNSTQYEKALVYASATRVNLSCDPSGALPIQTVAQHVRKETRVGIFIGPEGDRPEDERRLAREYNFHFVSLGNLILRAETVAIAASYTTISMVSENKY